MGGWSHCCTTPEKWIFFCVKNSCDPNDALFSAGAQWNFAWQEKLYTMHNGIKFQHHPFSVLFLEFEQAILRYTSRRNCKIVDVYLSIFYIIRITVVGKITNFHKKYYYFSFFVNKKTMSKKSSNSKINFCMTHYMKIGPTTV